MKINDVQINIRLSAKESERIKKAAEKAGISLSDYVRKALEDSSALRKENRELKKKLKQNALRCGKKMKCRFIRGIVVI